MAPRSERGGPLERFKPAAPARAHLIAAAALWTLVGTGLAAAGLYWTLERPATGAAIAIGLGAAIGAAKGRWVIARAARRNAARIVERGDGRCFGGFVSWSTWLVILTMMAAGALLRRSPLPRPVLGAIYLAVGTALLIGSRELWRARRRLADPARPTNA